MARISVVIPAYNASPYLAAAIDSVLGQEGAEIDLIVVDDGSADDSVAIAERYGDRLRLLRQSHAGPATARNTGVAAAEAEILAFLDADDLWRPGKLARQLAALAGESAPALVLGHVVQFISPELSEAERAVLRCDPAPVPGYLPSLLLLRAADFHRVGGFDPRLEIGDFIDWQLRAREAGLVELMCPEVLAERRLHLTNLGRRRRDARGDYARLAKAALDRRRSGQ
jgi:glycosyltransferase involved in cell wall biosynthesis